MACKRSGVRLSYAPQILSRWYIATKRRCKELFQRSNRFILQPTATGVATKRQPRVELVLFNLNHSFSIGELLYGILKVHTENFSESLIGRIAATQVDQFRWTPELPDQVQKIRILGDDDRIGVAGDLEYFSIFSVT